MRRNMDLVRNIAFAVEEAPDEFQSINLKFEGFTDDQIGYHVELMFESELLLGYDVTVMTSQFKEFVIRRLTSKGHDFVDAARNPTVWSNATRIVKEKVGGVTIDVMIQVLKAQAIQLLGLAS